ncbi:hypothetical protein PI125_g15227 [Phytophthora idaei]|nr:hypothetical protein PI125_g15227 [Phytophthora idaei]
MRTEKRVVRVRFSYKHRVFVENLIVLALDDKLNLVLGMSWLDRHAMINWEKRTLVRFGRNATESDGPVSVARAPQGAPDHSVEVAPNAIASGAQAQVATTARIVDCESNQNPIGPDLRRVSTSRGRDDGGASTPGVDQSGSDGSPSKITEGSAARRRGVNSASTPGVDDAASSVGGCKRPTPGKLAYSRAAGLHEEAICNQAGFGCVRPRKESADGYEINENSSKARSGRGTNGAGLHKKKRRRKRHKLRKYRSGTETLQEMSAGKTSDTTSSVETLNVLTQTGLMYRSIQLENAPS